MQHSTDRREAKVFRAHVPPHVVCDNLMRTAVRLEAPNGVLVMQDIRNRRDAKCLRRTLHRKDCVTT